MICTFLSLSADAWAAIAQWVTVGIAGAAAVFAYHQVGEARKTREAVAQPNVVVFSDLNPVRWQYVDLVVKNFGQTPAYNITLDIGELERTSQTSTSGGIASVAVPSEIAVLAPGQEWRTVWDSIVSRKDYDDTREMFEVLELPQLKTLSEGWVYFKDRKHKEFENPVRLDANMFRTAMRIIQKDSG